jgi:lipopolysaccharide export system protein LptA
MKIFALLSCLLLSGFGTLRAQTSYADVAAAETPPPAGSTVVTSDELQMDQATHTAVFTGNVVVVGTEFHMTCEEMTVYFTTANKINTIVSQGKVIILQPDRVTNCGHAVYYRDDDKFVLTDQPDILDNNNEISAPEITIYRTKKSLSTKGPTKTTIRNGIGSSTNSTAAPSASTPK